MTPIKRTRRGMTLVELLVVVAIIGLLAVSVSPLFQAGSTRRRFTEAADLASGHFNAVIARSIGRAAGDGAWLDATVPPLGAVTSLGFTRARNITGNMTVTLVNPASSPPTASFTPALPVPAGVVHVVGIPVPYKLTSTTTISFLPGYSLQNAAFPPLNVMHGYRATIAPQQRITASSTDLNKGFCIDLSYSTIGVHGLTDLVEISALAGADTVAVLFDATGRASAVWTRVPTPSPNWLAPELLDAQRPLALLIGESSRVGLATVASPSEENPGPNIQSPDAIWVVVDPGSRIVRTIPNNAATSTADAQAFVLQTLRNN